MKKLGKAVIDLKKDLWTTDKGGQWFHMNRRLVENRPDVKKFMAKFKKMINERRPSRRHSEEREQFFKEKNEARKQRDLFWDKIYKQVINDSFESPIPLRLDHDFEHTRDWRYCIYKGLIYQFDKPDLSDEKMIEQIEALEARV